jgi:cell division protein FtsB
MWLLTGLLTNKKLIGIGLIGVVAALVGLYIVDLKYEINRLEHDKLELNKTIDKLHKELNEITTSQKAMKAKIKKLSKLSPKIKYRTIEKIREVKSDECEKTKSVLQEIRELNFDDL